MSLKKIANTISTSANKALFKLDKNKPEIMIGIGIGGVVLATGLFCRATLKSRDILDEAQDKIENVHLVLESDEIDDDEYCQDDATKEMASIYIQTGLNIAKEFALPSIVLTGSIISITKGTQVLRKRNVAIAGAYVALKEGFEDYRERVSEAIGEEEETKLFYNLKSEKFIETVVDEETGEEKEVERDVYIIDKSIEDYSEFTRIFDDSCYDWANNASINLDTLIARQRYFNELLATGRPVFVNDVYKALGFKLAKRGQFFGWDRSIDPNCYIDFGIFNVENAGTRDFVNGYQPNVIINLKPFPILSALE